MSESYYIIDSNGELYHYGVKGMRWGVRRDTRLLLNSRRNKRIRAAKDAYKSGKISKATRDTRIKDAKEEKKATLNKIKEQFENAATEDERERIQQDIVNKTTKEVPNVTIKRGVSAAADIFSGINIGNIGMSSLSIAMLNPAFGGAALAAGAVGIAAEIGQRYLIQLGLDKTS